MSKRFDVWETRTTVHLIRSSASFDLVTVHGNTSATQSHRLKNSKEVRQKSRTRTRNEHVVGNGAVGTRTKERFDLALCFVRNDTVNVLISCTDHTDELCDVLQRLADALPVALC